MNANKRSKPHKLLVLEVLKNGRLSPNHLKMPIIEEELFKRTAGYKGEVAVDYYLKFLPQKEYTIFYGLRLPYEDTYFQIDTLLLSKKLAIILEIKNISGILYFDQKSEQMIRIGSDGNEQGFEDPLSQAKRQQRLLKLFIKQNGLPDLPIEYLIVISRPSTILKPLGSPIFHKVCHAHSLNLKIEQIENSHRKETLENKTIQKASRLLLKKHEPERCDIQKLYQIEKSDILTGVRCPACSKLGMDYHRGKWKCLQCGTFSNDAYLETLNEYYLLFGSAITNSEMRRFLHLPSSDISQKILKSINLPSSGSTRGRVYELRKCFYVEK